MDKNNRTEDGFYRLRIKKKSLRMKFEQKRDRLIVLRHGHIAITNYRPKDNFEFEKSLSTFDEVRWKYVQKAGYYVRDLHEFRLPRGYNLYELAKYFPNTNVIVDNDSYPCDRIDLDLLAPPKDDFQRVVLTFLCSQGEFRRNSMYTTLMVDAPTGDGKTWSGIAVTCFMRARAIIVAPMTKLLDQWKQSFLEFTSLDESEILIVRGSKLCREIIEGKHSKVKVFIFTVDTIVSFRDLYGDLETMELFMATNAYIKIIDEIHKDMRAVNLIEALSNQRLTVYMSATPTRADRKEKHIFRNCYMNVPKFGSKFKTKDEKHISVMVVKYVWSPMPRQVQAMIQKRTKWLNNKSYERELISSPPDQISDFIDKFLTILRWSQGLLVGNNKILILTETVAGTEFVQILAEQVFPGETSRYYGEMKRTDKEKALEARIICATGSSMGTGADVKGIQHVYNITTYSNEITAKQYAGRGRRLPDGTPVFYIEFVNVGFYKTVNQFESRKPYLLDISKTGKLMVAQ